MFVLDYPVDGLQGAEYNPRRITPEVEKRLRDSIRDCGFCKPVLVTDAGRLIAGHQRTNQARKLGRETIPAFVIRSLELHDEMRFNQLHNGADVDDVVAAVRVPPMPGIEGFHEIPSHRVTGDWRQPGAAVRNEIYRLILRYGSWGCCIATQSGEIVSSQQYALACKQALKPLRLFVIPDGKRELVRSYFTKEYGVFAYDKLPKNSWLQAYAQPNRGEKEDGETLSKLYDVLRPRLTRKERILDFGCGFGKVVRELQTKGQPIWGVEFWYKGGTDSLKPGAIREMCDQVIAELRRGGLFDITIADSVVNSVDSVTAEADVLTCLNALCRPGGEILFSGRTQSFIEDRKNSRQQLTTQNRRTVEFLDADGFSALPRGDKWFFQKFHTKPQVAELARCYIGPKHEISWIANTWIAYGRKQVEIPEADKRGALAREFNLPWPGGMSVDRAERALAAYDAAKKVGCSPSSPRSKK